MLMGVLVNAGLNSETVKVIGDSDWGLIGSCAGATQLPTQDEQQRTIELMAQREISLEAAVLKMKKKGTTKK